MLYPPRLKNGAEEPDIMARPKKLKKLEEPKTENIPISVDSIDNGALTASAVPEKPAEPAEFGNNTDLKKADELLKAVPAGEFCKHCNRTHKKTFNAPGINHEPFDPGGKAEIMFNSLCEQPKKPLFIPYEIGERRGTIQSPQLNGLRINILKGMYVEVPQQVAELVMESLQQTAAATDELMTFNREAGEYRNAKLDLRSEAHKSRLNQ